MLETEAMNENYYGPQAYHPDRIPQQQRQAFGSGRSWLNRKFDMRMPWGGTDEVAPLSFRKRFRPEVLRKIESQPNGFENIEFHQRIDHERYRHATPAFRVSLLNIVGTFGKLIFVLMFPVFFLASLVACYHTPSGMTFADRNLQLLDAVPYFFGIPLTVWWAGRGPLILFPRWAIKPSQGPKWEVNRRTGLVTVYHHKRKGPTVEEQAPFYEFDAYLTNEMIPPGQVVHTLYLVHRYSQMMIPIGNLIGKTTGKECFALWDMFQNFMDTSRPLPDIPLWEEFRPKDPVTAEHDRLTGRPPRYWRDMDDETWKQKESEMMAKVLSLATPYRANLMRRHVRYAS